MQARIQRLTCDDASGRRHRTADGPSDSPRPQHVGWLRRIAIKSLILCLGMRCEPDGSRSVGGGVDAPSDDVGRGAPQPNCPRPPSRRRSRPPHFPITRTRTTTRTRGCRGATIQGDPSLIGGSVSGAISRRISPRGCHSSSNNRGTAGRAARPQARIPSSASNLNSGRCNISINTGNV